MILVISVASFVILVSYFFLAENRVQEVGIFLSLGVPKFRIIGQIWSETIMIAVLSLCYPCCRSCVSKVTANYLVSQQFSKCKRKKRIMREKYPQNTLHQSRTCRISA
ncbi:MAG: FtsX-like permease family protein [[Clostridium] nexile]